ncbi:MAG: fasciclin domain-containing protein [Planctomycetaceae bacterium]
MLFRSKLRRRKNRHSHVNAEALETRALLTGNVEAALSLGTLTLRGDAESNSVEVRPNEDGDVTVYPTGGTTVNGSTDPFVVTEGNQLEGLRARLRSGDDTLFVEGVEIDGRVRVIGRAGDDAIGLYDTDVSGSVFILAGRGEDSVSLDETEIGGSLLIGTGRDSDTVGIDKSRVERSTFLLTGTDDDRVAVRDSNHKFVSLSTGYGDDFVAVQGTEIDGYAFAFAGAGDDELAIDSSNFDRRAFVYGGTGNDNAVVTDTEFSRTPRLRSFEGDEVTSPTERTDAAFLDLVASGARLGTIAELAILTPELSTLVDAVVAADLVAPLNGEDPLTVFAPTNEAFGKLPDGTLEDLLEDPSGQLTDILTYHVSPGAQNAAAVVSQTSLATLNGTTVDVDITDDGVFLNETTQIIATNIRAKNGFVHLIDSVLIPPAAT